MRKEVIPATFCDLIGGGPLDGEHMQIRADRTLIRTPLCIADDPAPGGRRRKYSGRWVHAYVRIDEDEFAYDGIRER